MNRFDAEKIQKFSPSLFMPGASLNCDVTVQNIFNHVFEPIKQKLPEPYFLDRLASGIFYRVPQLLGLGRDLSKMNALELGCGRGLKSIPWSMLFKRYWGVDLEEEAVQFAKESAVAVGRDNVEFILANVTDVLQNPARYGIDETINCIIMYAVLEHLTLSERRTVLSAIDELLRPDGLLILCETPNRLISHDGHSTYLHFFQQLPPDLAVEYINRSSRLEARNVAKSSNREQELFRFGMGVSFHEFELYMSGENAQLPAIVDDGWSLWQMFDEPFRRDELAMSDYFQTHGCLAHPAFARFWLEAVFDFAQKAESVPSYPKLFQPILEAGIEVRHRPEFWTTDLFLTNSSNRINIDFAGASNPVLQFDIGESTGAFGIFDGNGRQLAEFNIDQMAAARLERWHSRCAVSLANYSELESVTLVPLGGMSRLAVEGIVGKVAI